MSASFADSKFRCALIFKIERSTKVAEETMMENEPVSAYSTGAFGMYAAGSASDDDSIAVTAPAPAILPPSMRRSKECISVILLAKFDHASMNETHRVGLRPPNSPQTNDWEPEIYGGKDKGYAEAVGAIIEQEPPILVGEHEDEKLMIRGGALGGFRTFQSRNHQVIYGADKNGLCFAVVTGLQYPTRVAIQMLSETHSGFIEQFGSHAMKKISGSSFVSKKSRPLLSAMCQKYDDLEHVDKTTHILARVDEVKVSMQQNVVSMLDNMETTESIAAKSLELDEAASVFRSRAKTLRGTMFWRNVKVSLLLLVLIVVALLLLLRPVLGLVNNSRDKN